MHSCLTPPPSSTRGSSPDDYAPVAGRGRPSHNFTGLSLKTLQPQATTTTTSMTRPLRRTREPDPSPDRPIKRCRSLSPSSIKTNDDDVNGPESLPPIISYLSFVVQRAKAKHDTPANYHRRRPRTMELRFAEKYIGFSDMEPIDVERGKGLVEHSLSKMSSEAVAQAVLTKEADLEWKRLRALASAWEIEVSQRHTRLLQILLEDEAACLASASKEPMVVSFEALANCSMDELKTRTAFSIAAYGQDRASFIATDAQLDHLEGLAREHYLPLSDEDTPEEEVGACEQDSQASGEESPESVMVSDEDCVSQSGSDLPVCGSAQKSTKSHD